MDQNQLARIQDSVMNSQKFLIDQRIHNGLWSDFKTLAGFSTEWLSAYVANALAVHGDQSGKDVASAVLKKLLSKRILLRGWGYNHKVPPDADSTLWVVFLAQNLKREKHWRIARAKRFLRKHIDDQGALHTYYNSYAISIFTKLNKSKVSFEGWCGKHSCVTAAFAQLEHPQRMGALDYLMKNQNSDGFWKAYWWTNDEYATALTAEALYKIEGEVQQLALTKAIQWAENAQGPFSPFVAALLIRILLCQENPNKDVLYALALNLVDSQNVDGSWEASAFLRIPPPYITDPETYDHWHENAGGGGSYQKDYGRLFTSATVLIALDKLHQRFKNVSSAN